MFSTWVLTILAWTQVPSPMPLAPGPVPVATPEQQAHLIQAAEHLEAAGWHVWASELRTQARVSLPQSTAILHAAPPTRLHVDVVEMPAVPGIPVSEMLPKIMESLQALTPASRHLPGMSPDPNFGLLFLPEEPWQRTLETWRSRELARVVPLAELTIPDGQSQMTEGIVSRSVPAKIRVQALPLRLSDERCRLQLTIEEEPPKREPPSQLSGHRRRLQTTMELNPSQRLIVCLAADQAYPITRLIAIHWMP